MARNYKDEYDKFQDSPSQLKKRAALNRANHKRGTYGNNDGLDVSHTKDGIRLEKSYINKGRKEKSRMKGSKRNYKEGGAAKHTQFGPGEGRNKETDPRKMTKKERDAYVEERSMSVIGATGRLASIKAAKSVAKNLLRNMISRPTSIADELHNPKAQKLVNIIKGKDKEGLNQLRKEISTPRKMKTIDLKQQGGYLQGPSHKEGGMAAVIGGKEPVELEGGEYIIRKSSVDKIGKDNLAKMNKEGRIPTMETGGLTHKEKHRRRGAASMAKDILDDNPMNQIDVTKIVKHLDKGKKKTVKPKTKTKTQASGEPKLVTDKGHRAFIDSQRAILRYREDERKGKKEKKGKGPLPPAWTRDDKGKVIKKKKPTYSGQKTYDAEENVISSTSTNKKIAKAKTAAPAKSFGQAFKEARAKGAGTIFTWEGRKFKAETKEDVAKTTTAKKAGETAGKIEKKQVKKITKPVVKEKVLTPSEIDEQAQQDVLAGGKKRMKKQPPLKDRIPQSDFTKRMKKKTALDLRTGKQKKQAKWIKGAKKDTPYFSPEVRKKRAESAKKAEAEKAKRMKKAKRSKTLLGKSINKMKDLLNKRGKEKRVEGNSGVGLKFEQGGYMPSASIPAAPPFRQGMRMMGHGGVASVSNDKAGAGDVHTTHSHSGYKAGE